MKEEHYVCEGCGECFEDNFTEYGIHIEECIAKIKGEK